MHIGIGVFPAMFRTTLINGQFGITRYFKKKLGSMAINPHKNKKNRFFLFVSRIQVRQQSTQGVKDDSQSKLIPINPHCTLINLLLHIFYREKFLRWHFIVM